MTSLRKAVDEAAKGPCESLGSKVAGGGLVVAWRGKDFLSRKACWVVCAWCSDALHSLETSKNRPNQQNLKLKHYCRAALYYTKAK